MAFEYNFPPEAFETFDKQLIHEHLRKLDEEFTLIMIVELFDESLLLMKRLLNWELKNILYFIKNGKVGARYELIKFLPGDMEYYRKYARLDNAMYAYFYKRLIEKIQQQDNTFYEELEYFKTLNKDAGLYCKIVRQSETKMHNAFHVEETKWNDAFNVTPELCMRMRKEELDFVRQIRFRQYNEDTEYPERYQYFKKVNNKVNNNNKNSDTTRRVWDPAR